jgi:hypothetical protein
MRVCEVYVRYAKQTMDAAHCLTAVPFQEPYCRMQPLRLRCAPLTRTVQSKQFAGSVLLCKRLSRGTLAAGDVTKTNLRTQLA